MVDYRGGVCYNGRSMRILSITLALIAAIQLTHGRQAAEPILLLQSPGFTAGKKADTEADKAAQALHALLKAAAKNPDTPDKKGRTPLMLAAELDNRVAVCYLVARGADAGLTDKDGKNAVAYARSAGVRELLSLSIAQGAGPAITHEERERQAALQGLLTPESRRERLWQLVATPGHLDEVVEVLHFFADPEGVGPNGLALLQTPGLCPEYAAFFLRRGYDLKSKGQDGSGLLTRQTSALTGRLLLALGWKPAPDDAEGELLAAIFADDVKEARRLLAQRPELAAPADGRRSLAALALSAGMVQALTEAGAPLPELRELIAASAHDPRSAAVVQALIKAGAAVEDELLLLLCSKGSADAGVARVLSGAEAARSATDAAGNTALHHAAARGRAATVKALLEAGCDANAANAAHDTALHLLLAKLSQSSPADQVATLKALIKGGANPKLKNHEGQSGLQIIKSLNRSDLTKALKSK